MKVTRGWPFSSIRDQKPLPVTDIRKASRTRYATIHRFKERFPVHRVLVSLPLLPRRRQHENRHETQRPSWLAAAVRFGAMEFGASVQSSPNIQAYAVLGIARRKKSFLDLARPSSPLAVTKYFFAVGRRLIRSSPYQCGQSASGFGVACLQRGFFRNATIGNECEKTRAGQSSTQIPISSRDCFRLH